MRWDEMKKCLCLCLALLLALGGLCASAEESSFGGLRYTCLLYTSSLV